MSSLVLSHRSIADVSEHDLVDRILTDPLWHADLFEIFGNPKEPRYKTRVRLDDAPNEPKGDVDVLFCAPPNFGETVAVEVKRIKCGMASLRPGGRPNKLHEYEKAVDQANRLADIGFWKVYLYVITVVDAREQNAGKISYSGLSTKLKSLVSSVMTTERLQPRIGFCSLDFTQPMDHAPFSVGTRGMSIQRLATPYSQSADLTRWIGKKYEEG